MRAILDGFGAAWHRDDLGVVTTEIDVPDTQALHLPQSLVKQIRRTTRQVIKAIG
jgi:hypothetical protein